MIQFQHLNFGYRKRDLYRDFNLTIDQPGIYGILGTNGTGKSTLLKLIAGLLYPNQGICEVNGMPSKKRYPDMLKNLLLLPEEVATPRASALKYAAALSEFYPAFKMEDYRSILAEFGVKESDKMSDMSYGTKKKALIAFAVAAHPKILLLDEPTNGLDIPSKTIFRQIMVKYISDAQQVLISTHQVRDLDTILDRIILLNEGRLMLNTSVSEIESAFVMKRADAIQAEWNVLYSEPGLQGVEVLYPNTDNEPSRLHLELFFNAMIHNESQLKPYIQS